MKSYEIRTVGNSKYDIHFNNLAICRVEMSENGVKWIKFREKILYPDWQIYEILKKLEEIHV